MVKLLKELNLFVEHVYSEYNRTELPKDDIMDLILVEFFISINNDEKLNAFFPKITNSPNVFMYFNESYNKGRIMEIYNEKNK